MSVERGRAGGPAPARLVLAGAAVVLTLLVALSPGAEDSGPEAVSPEVDSDGARWVAHVLEGLSLREKIAQLVVPGLRGALLSTDSDEYERLAALARERGVGGFHVFGKLEAVPDLLLNPTYGHGGQRGRSADALGTAALLNRLQREARLPLLVTADLEGGAGYIVEGATRLPRAMALGATGDPALAAQAGEVTALEGRALGMHLCFFPIVDVSNNPKNPIINLRSYGESPARVAEMATAEIRGLHAGGMLATAKHWPGHGDTGTDTHLNMPVLPHSRQRLEEVELVPFRAAIAAGVDAVMTSHIHLSALDPGNRLPATLSAHAIGGLLRGELGFDGLVVTDSMAMHAISRRFSPGEAAARAVGAGVDVVLDPPDPEAALKGLEEAAATGRLSEERIDRSVVRILRAKARLGLHRERITSLMDASARIGGRAAEAVADEIASQAVTLLQDERHAVPLDLPRRTRVLYLSLVDSASGWREGAPSRTLLPLLRKRFAKVDAAEVSGEVTPEELDEVRRLARRCRAVVAAVFVRVGGLADQAGLSDEQVRLLVELAATRARPMVTVLLGNPYAASRLSRRLPALLVTYEYTDVAERAAARAILGEAPLSGTLPITLPGLFPAGHGLTRPGPDPQVAAPAAP